MRRRITRADILAAGRDIMFAQGYAGTGIKDITDQIRIPKGSFYNHFSSKEEFGLEMLREYADNGAQLYRDALLDDSKPPLKRLQGFFAELIKTYRLNMEFKLGCLMGNFSAEMADINENFRASIEEGFAEHERIIIECLQQAQEGGDIAKDQDCAQLGSFILNSWHGALLRMKSTGNEKPLDDFRAMIFDRLIR